MIIGLTGGIGSGKSTVARLFEMLGAAIFESDRAAKLVYFLPEVKVKVLALLGQDAYLPDSTLNRPYIADRVYSDKSLLLALNAIIHPAVAGLMTEFVTQHPGKLIVKESALLYETGLEKGVDKVIVVDAPEDLRIKRSMLRDHLSEAEVRKRMANQWLQAEKLKRAHFIILNDEMEPVIPQVLKIYDQLVAGHVS